MIVYFYSEKQTVFVGKEEGKRFFKVLKLSLGNLIDFELKLNFYKETIAINRSFIYSFLEEFLNFYGIEKLKTLELKSEIEYLNNQLIKYKLEFIKERNKNETYINCIFC